MAVNTKTEYALRILIELADKGKMSAQRICDSQRLPKKYIEHLLSMLKAAKIVHSRAGSLGGYFLSRKAENISLADILAAVEDGTFDTACESESSRHCIGEGCRLTMFFLELNERLHQVFQSYSLADIVKIYNKG